jgi:TM2 domain-containing membrane protein YozV
MNCATCGSRNVRLSRRWKKAIRFRRRWLGRGGRGKLIQLALFGAALMVFFVFLNYMTREHSDSTLIDSGSTMSASQ